MDTPSLQLNDIALFVEVAKRKSFSLAARALDMPTSTLSRRISQLESAIGLRLINRNTRRLELTQAGEIYMQRCQGLVEEARLAQEQLLALTDKPRGRLSVSIPYSLAIWLLPEAIHEFTERYPDLECEFDLASRGYKTSASMPFDLVLGFFDLDDEKTALADLGEVQQLGSLKSYLYASEDYLADHGMPETPEDLTRHDCLRTTMDDAHSWWTLRDGKREVRINVKGPLAGNNISILGTLAGKNMGIVRLPMCKALAPVVQRNALMPVLPDWHLGPLPVYAGMPSRIIPARTQAFLDFIRPMLEPVS